MQYLDNRIYPNLCPETIWNLMNYAEMSIFGIVLPKQNPKNSRYKSVESEKEKESFLKYYTNLLKDYKSRNIIPWFK